MTIRSDVMKGHLSALFTIIVWGSTFVAAKVLLRQFEPVEIIFLRFLLGWSFLWLIRPKRLSVGSRKTEVLFALAGLNFFHMLSGRESDAEGRFRNDSDNDGCSDFRKRFEKTWQEKK